MTRAGAGMKSGLVRGASALWALISQGANSGSNMLLGVLVARASTPAEFGLWSLGYIFYMVTVGTSRAACSTPILIHRGTAPSLVSRSGSVTLAMLIGAAASTVIASAYLFAPSFFAVAWPFALFLPLISVQDVLRSICFREASNKGAAGVDLSWLVLQIAFSVPLIARADDSPVSLTFAWGAAGALAVCASALVMGVVPSVRSLRVVLRSGNRDRVKLSVDQLLLNARTHATPALLAATAGLVVTGTIRAGQTMMGAINALIQGLTPVATVSAAKKLDSGFTANKFVLVWSGVIASLAAVNGLLLLAIPDSWGEVILGANWAGASSIFIPLVLQTVVRGPNTATPIVLKVRGHMNEVLKLRARTVFPAVAVPVALGTIYGISGAAWGIAATAVLTCFQSWIALRRSNRMQLERRLLEGEDC